MLRKSLSLLFAVGMTITASSAHAWGQNGHRIIGELAEAHLTEQTRVAIQPLLEGDSLAEISTWADEMRSDQARFGVNNLRSGITSTSTTQKQCMSTFMLI